MSTERLVKTLPLESGDRLSCNEFERHYNAMHSLKKAKLIEGVVYVASPLRAKAYGNPHTQLICWWATDEAPTPGVSCYGNPTVRLDGDNEPQPKVVLQLEQHGRSPISKDDYIEGSLTEMSISSTNLRSPYQGRIAHHRWSGRS